MNLHTLDLTPFISIVGEVIRGRSTGTLTVVQPSKRKTLHWSQGELILITSSAREESLASFLFGQGLIDEEQATRLTPEDPVETVPLFHDGNVVELPQKQSLLRDWTLWLISPLFSLNEGTAAFTDEEALDPDRRVFIQSTAAMILEGVRSITSGLVLRQSLGNMKELIMIPPAPPFRFDMLPLTEEERKIATTLVEPMPIDQFIRKFGVESNLATRVTIAMLALGMYEIVRKRDPHGARSEKDTERDLAILASIGSSDQRSLRAVSLARRLSQIDHYKLLDVPRAAQRNQIAYRVEQMKKLYDPNTFPPAIQQEILQIQKRIDEAQRVLQHASQRQEYDKALAQAEHSTTDTTVQQRVQQRAIAERNVERARELSAEEDYYGAIILLRQAVQFAPDLAEAWMLLGNCQERNPRWKREASASYQKALSINPNDVEAMISLGDLYKSEGLSSRAQSCYEEVLQIDPEHPLAKARLKSLRR